jgi:hypothetical protein
MKIYRIPINDKFRPSRQGFVWPPTNQFPNQDFGVENDFDEWILGHPDLLVDDMTEADYLYAPIFFNRYYFEALDSQGHWGGGLEELGEEVNRCLSYGMPTFTIAEADVRVIKPSIDWGDLIIFCASRRGDRGIDIPLLCGPHPIPNVTEKKYLASFMGNLETDGIRMQMRDELAGRTDCRIEHAGVPEEVFARIMAESYIALAPRGQGAQSYRFWEALSLGIVPLYISDINCLPFKNWIDWESCSLYRKNNEGLSAYLDTLDREHLLIMGANAFFAYHDYLRYGKWCEYVIRELEAK